VANDRLSGKVAIVTGGATGIGGGISDTLAADGSQVLIVDINEAGAEARAKAIRDRGGEATAMQGDVSKEDVARKMVARTVETYGRLDILVQNAYGVAGLQDGSALETEVEGWRKGMDLLVMAHFLGAKYGVPAMIASGPPEGYDPGPWKGHGLRHGQAPPREIGRIVNISSVHGLLQAAGTMVYESGKAAVNGLTRQMAVDFGPSGITVNAVAPGHIVTENLEKLWSKVGNEAGFHLEEMLTPVRRTGIPEDIANAVSYLCSPEASFVTGVVLPVDGGMSIQLQENIVLELKNYIQENPDLKTFFDGGFGTGDRR
jgi:NAD(P)-dependent dehydrogenase (short-subunit alcohol dehydrogenase family)